MIPGYLKGERWLHLNNIIFLEKPLDSPSTPMTVGGTYKAPVKYFLKRVIDDKEKVGETEEKLDDESKSLTSFMIEDPPADSSCFDSSTFCRTC